MAHPPVARRSFLGLASLTAAACASPRQLAAPTNVTTTGADRWSALREQFSLSRDRVHLAGLLLASNPKPVRDALDRFQTKLDEDPVGTLEHDFETGEYTNATLDAAARYIGAKREDIALTDSTTSGIGVVYGGLQLERGDDILTTKHDHFVHHEQQRLVSERTGATVRQVALYEKAADAREDLMVQAIEKAILPATRVVGITWVHSSTGVKTPVRLIADVVAKANASRSAREQILLVVDGVHGFGVENASMSELGCDFFIAGTHKWIFGPRGTGLVYGKPEAWARLKPTVCPFDFGYVMVREYEAQTPKSNAKAMTPGGFRNFESRWALKEAFDLHMSIGKAAVADRIHELGTQMKTGLAAMKHVKLHTPMDPKRSAGIVCFEIAGMDEKTVIKKLMGAGIVGSTTPYRPSYARFTPGLTNTPQEIEKALAAVKALA